MKNIVKGNAVIGLPVFSVHEGKQLAAVRDIIYDPKEQEVRALLIDEGGWFSDAQVILTDDVQNIGVDAVIISSENLIKKASHVSQKIATIAKESQYLTNTRIITENGTDLGKVTDIYFDAKSGRVIELEVSQGMMKNFSSGVKRVKVSDIVTVGEDATIVKAYTEDKLADQANSQGLQGAIVGAKDKVTNGAGTVKEQTPGIIDQVKQKAQELSKQAKVKGQQLTDKAQNTSKDLQAQSQIKSAQLQNRADIAKEQAQQKAFSQSLQAKLEAEQRSQDVKQKANDIKNDPATQEKINIIHHKTREGIETIASKTKENITHGKQPDQFPTNPPQHNTYIPAGTLGGRSAHKIYKGNDNAQERPVVEGTIIVSEEAIKKT